MPQTRRKFLGSATAALGTATLLPRSGFAANSVMAGEMEVVSLSDGYMIQPAGFILDGMDRSVVDPILARHGAGPEEFRAECNVTVLKHKDRVVLFDAGSGAGWLPTVGRLPDALDEIGIAPEDVTHVVFTHGHPDHLWGLLDDFDDLFFYEATHMMGKGEFDYWIDPTTADTIMPSRQNMFAGASRRLGLVGEEFETFEDGQEILPGVMARGTPGHTPHHMSFQIGTGSEAVVVVGDAVTNSHYAMERPDLLSGVDQEKEQAAQSRSSLLDQVASEQMRMVGFHLPGSGLGRVEKKGSGYRFIPDA